MRIDALTLVQLTTFRLRSPTKRRRVHPHGRHKKTDANKAGHFHELDARLQNRRVWATRSFYEAFGILSILTYESVHLTAHY